MCPHDADVVDMHFHVGLLGDSLGRWGRMSEAYRKMLVYKTFLLYAGIKESEVSDQLLRERTLETIADSDIDRVVCLALDPVYDQDGRRRVDQSYMWVDNDYVLDLQRELPHKILLGASVHPYDPNFEERVAYCVDHGAVLIKWLPSAQQIDLAEPRVGEALQILAHAGPDDTSLPLLLHVGPEYAVASTDQRSTSYDYLSWSTWDSIVNFFRFGKKWHVPRVKQIHANLESALREGADIIFAHCGLPYFLGKGLGKVFEHSELEHVREYLERTVRAEFEGRCYADVSALVTPFRRQYYEEIHRLPQELLLYGSDFPTPVFEITADIEENLADLRAMLKGDLSRIVVPQGNLLDVNYREMKRAYGDSVLFTNFSRQGFDRPVHA